MLALFRDTHNLHPQAKKIKKKIPFLHVFYCCIPLNCMEASCLRMRYLEHKGCALKTCERGLAEHPSFLDDLAFIPNERQRNVFSGQFSTSRRKMGKNAIPREASLFFTE